jgi:hypothetical protein
MNLNAFVFKHVEAAQAATQQRAQGTAYKWQQGKRR